MAETNFEKHFLPYRHISEVVQEAKEEIQQSRDGVQRFLRTRFPKMNKNLLGGFREGWVYVIGGLSGTGKSIFLTQMHRDIFVNNDDFHKPIMLLHFSFEMFGKDELIRSVSIPMASNYSKLVSVETPLTDEEVAQAFGYLEELENYQYYFIENPGTPDQVYNTVMYFRNNYPNVQLVVSIDHSLLIDHSGYHNEMAMIAGFSKMLIELKKKSKAMVILLAQMNSNIEKPDRIGKKETHYPVRSDLYGSAQLGHAADSIMIMHAPERLNIESYGPQEYPTKGLIALHWVKNRNGPLGVLRLKGDLSKGLMRQWTEQDTSEVENRFGV